MKSLFLLSLPLVAVLITSCELIPYYPPQYHNLPGNRELQDRQQEAEQQANQQLQDENQAQQVDPKYPLAEWIKKPDQVLSPYAPYNVIDVQGFRSGQLARDPSNGKIFRIP